MKILIFLSLLLSAAHASGEPEDVDPAPATFKVSDDVLSLGVNPRFQPGYSLQLRPELKAGVLTPFDSSHLPYPTARASPFWNASLAAEHRGPIEALAIATIGQTNLRSRKPFSAPFADAVSPASSHPERSEFSQYWLSGSFYGDIGLIRKVNDSVTTAVFASVDAFGIKPTGSEGEHSGIGVAEASVGNMWMYARGGHEVSGFAHLRLEAAAKTMFRNPDLDNKEVAAVPSGTAGVEYARLVGDKRVTAGLEGSAQRADLGLRPYAGVSGRQISAVVAGNYRRSQDDFYPDAAGGGAQIDLTVTPAVSLGVSGNFAREKFSLAPGSRDNYSLLGMVSVETSRLFKTEASRRAQSNASRRPYEPSDTRTLEERMAQTDYATIFKNAITRAKTFDEFINTVPVKGVDDILAAVAAFTSTFNDRNYNHHEGSPQNVNSIEELYERGRASYLSGDQDAILVCIGSSQFAAVLAETLGSRAGIAIEASAVGVAVPDKTDSMSGHAVVAIKTKDYGIVFADWGRLTPTHTWDTREALAIYQALQGIPALYHAVTAGRDGHPVGYLFTDWGKSFTENQTFHGNLRKPAISKIFRDDPNGARLTEERFRRRLRQQP